MYSKEKNKVKKKKKIGKKDWWDAECKRRKKQHLLERDEKDNREVAEKRSESQIREKLKELCKLVWSGKGFPEEWREGLIAPIYKKGDASDVRRGLTERVKEIYETDVEEEMRRGQVGEVWVGKERIWTLAYADDLVILAKSEEGMKEMLKRMERFLNKKKLQLNTDKYKMVCFKKGGGRRGEREWKWEGEKIEEVTEPNLTLRLRNKEEWGKRWSN
ncbi:neurofilament medium polypeptide-like protein [Lasius niger]|uniref:Neurofilament medium polypeptide-like protein n=1 Tax=Lasius niger TaxID=67767 RepID=A0A0J7K2J5_LASNI|nr:neurofilament medium polypeptide-like protein [Lasius niger]